MATWAPGEATELSRVTRGRLETPMQDVIYTMELLKPRCAIRQRGGQRKQALRIRQRDTCN